MEKNKTDPVILQKAVELSNHSIHLRDAGYILTSIAVGRKAVSLAPNDARVVGNLGNVLMSDYKYKEAETLTKLAMEMDPALEPALHHNIGLCYFHSGQYDKAEYHLAKIPQLTDAVWDRAAMCMLLGRWKEGFDLLESRRVRAPEQHPAWSCPEWDGKPFEGTLWVTCEQGIGDIVQFARYLPWAASCCNRLVLSVPPPLMCLFMDYPGVSEVRVWDDGIPEPAADFHCALMTLPRWHGSTPDNVPEDPGHFTALAAQFPAQFKLETGAYKIAICWAGNVKHKRNRDRSIPFERFLPLLTLANTEVFSVQVGARARDIDTFTARSLIVDVSQEMTSWLRTASTLLQMDLVITVDTAVAHLAGAMGVKTWLLLSKVPDWRWLLDRKDTPWYPSMRLFRQQVSGQWDMVFSTLLHRLKEEVEAGTLRHAAE